MSFLNSLKEAVDREEDITTFVNPFSYCVLRQEPEVIGSFTVKFDGMVLSALYSFLISPVDRCSFDMTSMAPVVFERAVQEKKTVYFIGARSEEVTGAVRNILARFPDLQVIGCRDGYFANADELEEVCATLGKINPDIVICGMGTPLQEKFLLKLKTHLWRGVGFTCGGFLHQSAGDDLEYYPRWVNVLNLRWLYRMYREPKVVRRVVLIYPLFLGFFAVDWFRMRIAGHFGRGRP